jgi:hypothetical protein
VRRRPCGTRFQLFACTGPQPARCICRGRSSANLQVSCARPRPGADLIILCLGCFSSKLPPKRHPERSASRIYRVTQRLMARSRRTPTVLILPMLFGPFRPPKPENRILLRYPLDGHGYIFSCTVIIFHPQVCARSWNSGLIVPMRLSFFSRRQPLSCFSRAMAVRMSCLTLKVEQALATIGRSETFQRALLMLHDAQIQVAGDATRC